MEKRLDIVLTEVPDMSAMWSMWTRDIWNNYSPSTKKLAHYLLLSINHIAKLWFELDPSAAFEMDILYT